MEGGSSAEATGGEGVGRQQLEPLGAGASTGSTAFSAVDGRRASEDIQLMQPRGLRDVAWEQDRTMQKRDSASGDHGQTQQAKLLGQGAQLTLPAGDNTLSHVNAHHDAQVDRLLATVASRRDAQKALADSKIAQDSERARLLRPEGPTHVTTTKRQRDEHTQLQAAAYRGMFCEAGVCPAPVCNCESPDGGW